MTIIAEHRERFFQFVLGIPGTDISIRFKFFRSRYFPSWRRGNLKMVFTICCADSLILGFVFLKSNARAIKKQKHLKNK
jgi:hypothetical protein